MGMIGRDILQQVAELKAKGEAFALATVVRTVAVTAAKAGAKAVIRTDGTISDGWVGGGCARGAVLKAAREALADGQPRLISVSPEDVLAAQGVAPGDTRDGVRFARSMCPSRGTMDIFIEPMLPQPELVVFGTSPVALALAAIAGPTGFVVTACLPPADLGLYGHAGAEVELGHLPPAPPATRYLVVATQGRGDEAALRAALAHEATYTAFVGSRAKMAALRAKLADVPAARLDAVEAPAGLNLGAITPEEIALSILARMVSHRRQGQRQTPEGA